MSKILANDGISDSGKVALEKKGFQVITEKVDQENLPKPIIPKVLPVSSLPPEKAFLRDLKFSSPSRGICLFDSYKNLTIPKRCAKTNSATDDEDAAGVL